MNNLYSTSGEPITVSLCRNCKKEKATGVNFIRADGVSIFKCDACGKSMRCGLIEQISNTQKKSIDSHEQRVREKDRKMRELSDMQKEQLRDDSSQEFRNGALSRAGFLWAHFMD